MRYSLLYKKNKGFSLIELSVVIVIIAMLVASIMGGTRLVKSAKISAVVKEIGEIKTAIDAFEIKYAALPGDFVGASNLWSDCTTIQNGDGDKSLRESNSDWDGEQSFTHMYYADIWPRAPVNTSLVVPSTICTGLAQQMVSAVFQMLYHLDGLDYISDHSTIVSAGDKKRSFIVLDGITSGGTHDWMANAISTNNAFQIDNKMDDGNPDKGQVVGSPNFDVALGTCISSGTPYTYDLAQTGKICTMFFRFR